MVMQHSRLVNGSYANRWILYFYTSDFSVDPLLIVPGEVSVSEFF